MTVPDTTFIAEPGSHEMIISAVLDAPKEAVFKAHTDPDLLAKWWGPAELTTTVERLDATSGGTWRVIHADPEGNEYGFHGVHHEVTPSERIIQTFEFEGQPGHVCLQTITFDEVDGKTTLTEHAVFQSVEDRDGMKESGAESHAPVGMAQLAEVLKNL